MRLSKSAKFFSALIRRAYLPSEVPPVITAADFASFCGQNYTFVKSHQSLLAKTSTEFELFTAPRAKSGRRNFTLVHPLAQANVSLLITEHRNKIKHLIGTSKASLYRTDEDLKNFVAFSGLDFAKRSTLRARAYSECSVVLNADISRFFVYTHSIPWAVIGKEKAKDWLENSRNKLNNHWSGKIDRALQLCQSRETFGIPVGPDTSRIIAEILLAGIESEPALAQTLRNAFAFRLVDDFTLGFDSEEDALSALTALRKSLSKYNLQLNDEKTSIVSARSLMRPRWELEHEAFEISDDDVHRQALEISRFIELTYHLCRDAGTDAPALWTCRRILQLKNVKENCSVILDGLFRLARDFPRCLTYVSSFVIYNQDFCANDPIRGRVERWCRSTIKQHLDRGHDFEISWSLAVCGALKIRLEPQNFNTKSLPSPSTLALLGLLYEKGYSSIPLSRWPWRARLNHDGVTGSYWLPFYEAVLRGWTKDKSLLNQVNANPILARMLSAGVTFLDDRIFDAARITLPRRLSAGGAKIRTKAGIAKYRSGPQRQSIKLKSFRSMLLRLSDLDY
jgi:hypothetical protein